MEENIIKPKSIKIGFLGDTYAGKTAICKSYLGEEFSLDMIASIGI